MDGSPFLNILDIMEDRHPFLEVLDGWASFSLDSPLWCGCCAVQADIPISAFQTFISTLALSQIGPSPAFSRSFSPNWCFYKILMFSILTSSSDVKIKS